MARAIFRFADGHTIEKEIQDPPPPTLDMMRQDPGAASYYTQTPSLPWNLYAGITRVRFQYVGVFDTIADPLSPHAGKLIYEEVPVSQWRIVAVRAEEPQKPVTKGPVSPPVEEPASRMIALKNGKKDGA